MIFHITATHTHATCYAHDESKRDTFVQTIMASEAHDVKVLSCTVNAGAHILFLLIEADSMAAVTAWMGPILPFNDYETIPVVDMKAAVESLKS